MVDQWGPGQIQTSNEGGFAVPSVPEKAFRQLSVAPGLHLLSVAPGLRQASATPSLRQLSIAPGPRQASATPSLRQLSIALGPRQASATPSLHQLSVAPGPCQLSATPSLRQASVKPTPLKPNLVNLPQTTPSRPSSDPVQPSETANVKEDLAPEYNSPPAGPGKHSHVTGVSDGMKTKVVPLMKQDDAHTLKAKPEMSLPKQLTCTIASLSAKPAISKATVDKLHKHGEELRDLSDQIGELFSNYATLAGRCTKIEQHNT